MRAGGAVRAGAPGMVMVMVVTNEGRFYTVMMRHTTKSRHDNGKCCHGNWYNKKSSWQHNKHFLCNKMLGKKLSTKRVANAYTFCATKRWEKVVNKTSSKRLHFFTLFALKMLQKRLHFFTLFALAKRLHFSIQICQQFTCVCENK